MVWERKWIVIYVLDEAIDDGKLHQRGRCSCESRTRSLVRDVVGPQKLSTKFDHNALLTHGDPALDHEVSKLIHMFIGDD